MIVIRSFGLNMKQKKADLLAGGAPSNQGREVCMTNILKRLL